MRRASLDRDDPEHEHDFDLEAEREHLTRAGYTWPTPEVERALELAPVVDAVGWDAALAPLHVSVTRDEHERLVSMVACVIRFERTRDNVLPLRAMAAAFGGTRG